MLDFEKAVYQIIGERLKNRREEVGISQVELAENIKEIGRTSISNIEKGRQQTPIHVLYKICNELAIDINSILPTQAEINARVNNSEKSIDVVLKSYDLDENTLKQINELLKDQENDL